MSKTVMQEEPQIHRRGRLRWTGPIVLALGLLSAGCPRRDTPPKSRRDSGPAEADAGKSAPAVDQRACGYVDRTGKLAIARGFDQAADFAFGLAAVTRDRKSGFIDSKGSYAIPPTFDAAKGFREGVAAVCVARQGWGFIDTKGAWVIPPAFAFADGFAEGTAVVKLDTTDLEHACIGLTGKEVPPGSECESDENWNLDDPAPGQYFLVDRTGKRLHERGAHCITRMSEGRAAARWKDKWGYLGRDGKQAIPTRYLRAKPFGEGWAAVAMAVAGREADGGDSQMRWAFIDGHGRLVAPLKYRAAEVGVFSQGLVAMEGLPIKTFRASPVGRACVPPRDDEKTMTADELRAYKEMPAECGAYLDKRGTLRVAVPICALDDSPLGFRSFREFSEGFAEVVMQEPMRITPFECAPALMGTVRTFVDPQGRFQPAAEVLLRRSTEGLVPKCRRGKASHEAAPFLWE
jgi:hypothetical protein